MRAVAFALLVLAATSADAKPFSFASKTKYADVEFSYPAEVAAVPALVRRLKADLAKEREPEPLFAGGTGEVVERLLSEIADALVSFAVLVTTHVSLNADAAESRLTAELRQAAATRDKLAQLLLERLQHDARQWQLHGAVLTEVNRIIDELDTEHRSRRLLEELDRVSREQRERMPRLTRLVSSKR